MCSGTDVNRVPKIKKKTWILETNISWADFLVQRSPRKTLFPSEDRCSRGKKKKKNTRDHHSRATLTRATLSTKSRRGLPVGPNHQLKKTRLRYYFPGIPTRNKKTMDVYFYNHCLPQGFNHRNQVNHYFNGGGSPGI